MSKTIIRLFLMANIFLLFSCTNDQSELLTPGNNDNDKPVIETTKFQGELTINNNTDLKFEEMEVVSFYEKKGVNEDGSFTLESIKSENYQIALVHDKNSNKPIYMGIADPLSEKFKINDTTTALALTLINPYLILSTKEDRSVYLEAVRNNPRFSELIFQLNNAYETDGTLALDYDVHPEIYQLSVQIMQSTLESKGLGILNKSASIGGPPSIEDGDGQTIKIINPRYVHYAAGIYPNNADLLETVTCFKADKLVSFKWEWPPLAIMEPAEVEYNLGNGLYKIYITKGFDFTKFTQWDDPMGRATMMNTGQTLLYLLDLVLGSKLGDLNLASLPNHFHIPLSAGYSLGKKIVENDAAGFLIELGGLIIDNADEIVFWIWQETANDAASHFLHSVAGILSNAAVVIKILGFANEQGPFFFDLIFAPKEVTYTINHSNGMIISNNLNNSPTAEFLISPPAGIIGTKFTFDASNSNDDLTNFSELEFRWDFDGDGIWDRNWTRENPVTYAFDEDASYLVTLDVKDSDGLIGTVTHKVNVGGGAGTAEHIKLFMDGLPWESNAMVKMLEALGFQSGVGANAYEIIPSSEMDQVELRPGYDLVIISNDQNQDFYNNYSANQVKFSNFVYAGGALFWEACDLGWAEGSISNANIVLPGNIKVNFDYDTYNYVTDQNLPLVNGLPNQLDHNYASHESFYDLPDGTTVYTVDESGNPTLIEFNLEGGWVIMTGQPLEHQYDRVYENNDMEILLPRIVSYFTGKEFLNNLSKRSIKNYGTSDKPSLILKK